MKKSKGLPVASKHDRKMAQRCAHGRVVIVDDDAALLRALSELLELEGYACETHTSAEAYLQVLNYNKPSFPGPYCVLIDVRMPGMGGLELQRQLALAGNTPVLLMSGVSTVQEVVSAYNAGALRFLLKPIEAQTLLEAIAEALEINRCQQLSQKRKSDLDQLIQQLNSNELEVASRVATGKMNQEIADALGISLRTVKFHRRSALLKLNVDSVAELARLADAAGW